MADLENKEVDLKYKFARVVTSDINTNYIYRNVVVRTHTNISYLHFDSKDNFTRNIRNEYKLCIKDNTFKHEELVVIFTNAEYLVEVLERRILKLFKEDCYDNLEDSFEAKFNKATQEFIFSIEYQLQDEFQPDNKDKLITEVIIDTLYAGAEELKDIDEETHLKIVNEVAGIR